MTNRVGQQFGHYKLTRLLGKGGFAEVYLGRHIYLGSEAAIKVILNELSDTDKELFIIEGRTLVRLIHPHIVRLLDFGIESNIPYFVMDYAPNGSLREKHPLGTQLPLATIVSYVNQAAQALQYAHDQKLIHRDVKPENMLLNHNNEVVISDFGIAVVAHSTQSMRTEEAIGTVSYMAPEQLQKKPRPASDQYALAVVVYEWFSGLLPFTGTQIEVAMQHLTEPVPSLRNIVPNLPLEVERVVLQALEKDPERRYESIGAFAQTLEQVSQMHWAPTIRINKPVQYVVLSTSYDVFYQKTKEIWLEEGNKYSNAQQFRDAITSYDYAIKLDPQFAIAYYNRGLAYDGLKEYKKAIEDYNRSIVLNSQFAAAYASRADAYDELGEPGRALEDYNRSITLDPMFVLAYNNRGYVYYKLKKYRRAIADYDQVLALDPYHTLARNNRESAYRLLYSK